MTNEQFSQGLKKNIDRVREYELGMDGAGWVRTVRATGMYSIPGKIG